MLTEDQKNLAEYMSELSEESYCAGWLSDLEFDLWRIINSTPQPFGMITIDNGMIDNLKALSLKCGGWIYWDENSCETFISFKDWKIKHDNYQ